MNENIERIRRNFQPGPSKRGEYVHIVCPECGAEKEKLASQVWDNRNRRRYQNSYCSRTCRDLAQRRPIEYQRARKTAYHREYVKRRCEDPVYLAERRRLAREYARQHPRDAAGLKRKSELQKARRLRLRQDPEYLAKERVRLAEAARRWRAKQKAKKLSTPSDL